MTPREKLLLTAAQAAGHETSLGTLNTNSDAYQIYNPDPQAPGPPTKLAAGGINPGLKTLSDDMAGMMRNTAGLYAASVGDNPNVQSGVAIGKLQDKGRLGSSKYFKAMKRAMRATGRILIDAIPKVYDTRRQIRIMNEDGSFEMATLNQIVLDQQSGQIVTMNDLSDGKYDITIMAGPSFNNRQQETAKTIVDIGTIDPTFIEMGGDILASNITAPGMDLLAARKRQQLFNAGVIPPEQQTDDEKAIVQKQQQTPPPPDPLMVAAEAEAKKADAQTGRVMVQAQSQKRQEDRKDQQLQFTQQAQRFDQFITQQQLLTDQLTAQAESMETLSKAFGTENIPGGLPALLQQIQLVLEAQDAQ
jgi:hypothetical protein